MSTVANRMLARAGLDAGALECGAHWPSHQPSSQALARAGGAPSALAQQLLGQACGFRLRRLCGGCGTPRLCRSRTHPVQREVRGALEGLTGADLAQEQCGIDGCSIPTWAMPLAALAQAFARFGTGQGLGRSAPRRRAPARRVRGAALFRRGHRAFLHRDDEAVRCARVLKIGAEGVYCAALPEQGLGVAIKCDDGASRAAEVVMAASCRTVPAHVWRGAARVRPFPAPDLAQLEWDRGGWIEGERNSRCHPGRPTGDPGSIVPHTTICVSWVPALAALGRDDHWS